MAVRGSSPVFSTARVRVMRSRSGDRTASVVRGERPGRHERARPAPVAPGAYGGVEAGQDSQRERIMGFFEKAKEQASHLKDSEKVREVAEKVKGKVEDVQTKRKANDLLEDLEILTLRPDQLGHADRAAGLDDDAIRDAALVCALFSMITRLADTLNFAIPATFDNTIKALTSRMGYRMPLPVFLFPRV
jgi:hypothetical protein